MGTRQGDLDVDLGIRRQCVVAAVVLLVSVLSACEHPTTADMVANQHAAAAQRAATKSVDWAHGKWETIPAPPAGVSAEPPAVWTGEDFIVWGTPGAALHPADRRWRSLPPAPIADRAGMVAVWTGTEVIYWGGAPPDHRNELLADGAAYNPRSNSWRLLPPSPLPPRLAPVASMVQNGLVLWGGFPECNHCMYVDGGFADPAAARYDPATNSWSRLGNVPGPWGGGDGADGWLTVNGSAYVYRQQRLGQYDAATDQWRELPRRPDTPPPLCAVSGGPVAIAEAWGSTIFTWSGGCQPEYGFAFDTATAQWRPTAKAPTGGDWVTSSTIGNGAVILETWPQTAAEGSASVHAYVVADDRWVDLPAPPAGSFGIGAHLAWTGSELIAWGGLRGPDLVLAGALYRAK